MKRSLIGILALSFTTLIACQDTIKTPPKIISFTATPSTLSAVADVKLEWVVENATGLSISPDIGGVEGTSTTYKITSSKTFTLTAKNDAGQDSKSVTVAFNETPPTITVDPNIAPEQSSIPDTNGQPIPVAVVRDGDGVQTLFPENRVVIAPKSKSELDEFLQRYHGQVIASDVIPEPPAELGIQVQPVDLQPSSYTVRLDASKFSQSKFRSDALRASVLAGESKVSSTAGAGLLALITHEQATGVRVSPDFLMQTQTSEMLLKTQEQNNPVTGGDAFGWLVFNKFGRSTATSAWQFVAAHGDTVQVRVAVIDGGFWLNEATGMPNLDANGRSDYPFLPVQYDFQNDDRTAGGQNPTNCSRGSACPWHGNGSASVIAGILNNQAGVAGLGGQVTEPLLFKTDISSSSQVKRAVDAARVWGAKVINMSFGGDCNWWCRRGRDIIGFYNAFDRAHNAGIMMVASAGNGDQNGIGYDAGNRVVQPCTITHVFCIGALESQDAPIAKPYSNYGAVHLWAPTDIPAMPDGSSGGMLVTHTGTSAAAPYVSGVVAMMRALNPSLTPDQLGQILLNTAGQDSTDPKVTRYINAFEAVKTAGSSDFEKDRFEINNTEATATPLTPGFYNGLNLHNSSDIDFYKLNFADEKSLVTFDFRYIDRLGTLNSAYLSPSKTNCGLPRLKKISSPPTPNNQRTLQYEVAQGSHTLRVGTANRNVYTMNIGVTGIPVKFDPDEFDTPKRNDTFAQSSQLGFRDNYSEIQANFDNGQDADWYVIYSSGTKDPLRENGTAFHFDISSSDVPVSIQAYQYYDGKLVLYDQDDSTADCTKPPTLFLPDGMYYVRVSSSNFKHGNYVFGTGLHINLRIPKIVQLLTVKDIRPAPGGVEIFELLGKSDGRVFTVPVGVKGVQILEQGFHAQVLDLSGNVLREGQAIFDSNARSSTRAGEQQIGEELSFDGLSNDQQYILGVFRNDTPDGLTEEEISRLPVIPYSLKVLSDALPDQTPPKAELLVNTPIVLNPQTVTITADASDDVRVDGVAFYEDEQLVSMDTQAPYTLEMTYSMLRNGSHTYSAKIYDSAGNVALAHNTVNVGVDISNMILNPGADFGFGESNAIPPVEAIPAFAPMNGFTVVRYGSPNGFPSLDLAAQIAGEVNFFTGGTSDISSATQIISVVDAASLIDSAPSVSYELSGYLGGYADQNDYAEVSLVFLNVNGIEVGSEKLKPVNATERQNQTTLLLRQTTGILPPGTRIIQLKVTMTKVEADARNDGYVDNLRFSLHKL
jgi:Subtilase family/Bacterial Ig domain